MARTHVVKAGDHIPKLADASGFGSHEPIWNHAKNADLAQSRTPCILNPGDEVFIPDLTPKTLTLANENVHQIVVKRPKVNLRLAVLDPSRKPIAGASGELRCESATFPVTLDGDGRFDQPIPIATETCNVVLGDLEFAVLVGHLAPATEVEGWRQRLNNLGYQAGTPPEKGENEEEGEEGDDDEEGEGDDDSEDEQPEDPELRSAIEEFQCDNGLTLTGKRDATTQAKVVKIHGS